MHFAVSHSKSAEEKASVVMQSEMQQLIRRSEILRLMPASPDDPPNGARCRRRSVQVCSWSCWCQSERNFVHAHRGTSYAVHECIVPAFKTQCGWNACENQRHAVALSIGWAPIVRSPSDGLAWSYESSHRKCGQEQKLTIVRVQNQQKVRIFISKVLSALYWYNALST